MANGPSSQVPSLPQRGGRKTYSQMVNEQLGLIQRQRAANFEQRIAQEQKNREFRTEQLQNIYDFDVSGLASGDAKLLKELQTELANSLDPNSENSYSSSRELVSDIAFINNVYGEMKRWGQTGAAGRQSYQQSILNPDREDGTVFTGNEELLDKRNATWEQGAFASAEILGEAGNRQIIGNVLDQDGNVMEEGVDFFQNVWRNQPDQFWRPEIGQGDFMDVRSEYASNRAVDQSNVEEIAANKWNNNPRSVQNKYRIDKARRNNLELSDLYNDDGETFIEGYTDEDLIAEYINEAVEGVGLRKSPEEEKMSPTSKQRNQMAAYQGLFDSIVRTQETVTVAPGMAGGEGFSELRDSITFSPDRINGEINITPFLPESLTKSSLKNPRAEEQGQPENILVDTEVSRSPGSVSVTSDGMIVLSGLGNANGQSIGDVIINPNTAEGAKAIASLSGLFRDAYGVSFNEFLRSLNMNFEVPETVVSGGDPLNLFNES